MSIKEKNQEQLRDAVAVTDSVTMTIRFYTAQKIN